MKARVQRGALAELLGAVSRAAASRHSVRILTSVRLEAADDRLIAAATDTELSIRAAIPAEVADPGVAVVPARTLLDLVRKLPTDDVTLESAAELPGMRVASGNADYALNTFAAADFPTLPTVDQAAALRLERVGFLEAVARVARAASRDASRPVYTGVLMRAVGGELTLVATDGHRLAVNRTAVRSTGDIPETLIPVRALEELGRLPITDEWLDVVVTENAISFEAGGYSLISRRLNGEFQRYEPLLAMSFAHEASIERDLLLDAVDRATVMLQRNSPVVLAFTDDAVSLRVTTSELGEATERIPLVRPGPELSVAFNSRYLLDGLQLVEGSDVRFKLNDDLRPVVLQGDRDDFTYLVGPIRRPR